MSRDDEPMGWSGADKSPLVVVRQQADGNSAAAATRAAGSLILILFMLAAVVLAVLAITMHNIYEGDLGDETVKGGDDRRLVIYRNDLDTARRASPIGIAPTLCSVTFRSLVPEFAARSGESAEARRQRMEQATESRRKTLEQVACNPQAGLVPELGEIEQCAGLEIPEDRYQGTACFVTTTHPQFVLDRTRAHNATLRLDNRTRANAAVVANRPRPEPDFNRRPDFLGPSRVPRCPSADPRCP